ncbi:toll/interleukin-1 receptor domain-containing protein [Mycobacterium intracellulare]|uniref:toll/interleukin-1 receptor domain-containing protein n=1 Tax=Mycobacterium intracellulare TaxID=1767 RepID=UPI001CDA4441|nr:toll/interleukin-1 receptor domain-containing protein [Mycobacterium intracellulare]MCA2305154.1 toll/interleukin-1 receptor domain-containing protein [Mycobacterium intracellulare]MCA2347484.1 toll/interleukin-1 receptor domain-containing protein [Mycobacterium intracellulare]
MADEQDFRIFISWSGPLAKSIARALRDWLPTMFDNIDPWFSDTDIPAGTTWFGEIQQRLDSSRYGIIVITTENVEKPWLNFEAGSLSKKLGEDATRVTPLLVNFNQVTELTNHPLDQYNAVLLDKDGVGRLCTSIALAANRNTNNVSARFEQMWQQLEAQIDAAKSAAGDQPPPPDVSEPQQLQALTASVRSLEATVAQLARAWPQMPMAHVTLPPEFPLMRRLAELLGTRLLNGTADNDGDAMVVQLTVSEPGLRPEDIGPIMTAIKGFAPDKPAEVVERVGSTIRRHTAA